MKIHNIINESEIASEHVKGGLDSYYQLIKAKRLAKADGHDYDKLPEYDRGADQPHKEKYMALAKEVKEEGKRALPERGSRAKKNKKYKESLESLAEHVKRQVPLHDSIFRYQSEAYFDTFKTAKKLREAGSLPELDWESEEMLGTDIGESVELKGVGAVWLDVPYLNEEYNEVDEAQGTIRKGLATVGIIAALMGANNMTSAKHTPLGKELQQAAQAGDSIAAYHLDKLDLYMDASDQRTLVNLKIAYIDDSPRQDVKAYLSAKAGINEAEYQGKEVKLNKPKRGGSKKYYVYVKTPKGNVKKISFGDVTGLKSKANNAKATKSFVARHNCKQKNDKQKAGYWACRLPRYGLVKGGQWW